MAERIEMGKSPSSPLSNFLGVYDLSTRKCLVVNPEKASSRVNQLIIDSYDTSARDAITLNRHQEENYTAIQTTRQALQNNQLQIAAARGLEIKTALEDTKRQLQAARAEARKIEFDLALADLDKEPGTISFQEDSWTENLSRQLSDETKKIAALEAKKLDLENSLSLASDLVVQLIRQNSFDPNPLFLEGRIGSALAALGLYEKAEVQFNKAADQAKESGLELEAADFRFQSILAEGQDGKNLEATSKRLEDLFVEIDREVGLRQNSPEDFGLWLETQGDTESWRTLRAEVLGGLLEIYFKQGDIGNTPKVDRFIANLTDYFKEAKEKGLSEEETMALLDALAVAQRWQVVQGYRLGADGKKEALSTLSEKMVKEYETAMVSASWHPDHHEIQESLGLLEGLTYFHLWQQAGLPTQAVFSYWDHTAKSLPSEAKERLKKTIYEKAPHFFDDKGNLLAKEQIPLPKDAGDAAFAENSLHYDDASFSENLFIGGGTSIAGAAVGAKAGALAGAFCGPFFETCSPVGAVLGGAGGYFGGEKIIQGLHAKEREEFVKDAKLAGLPLGRLTLDEAHRFEMIQNISMMGGVGLSAVLAGPMSRSGSKLFSGLGWVVRPETWRFVGRQILYEGHYTLRWLRALKTGTEGLLTGAVNDTAAVSKAAPAFEDVWKLMPPWRKALGEKYWQARWSEMMAYKNGAATAVVENGAKEAAPFIDHLLGPLNRAWDGTIGHVTRFGSSRLQAIRQAVLAADPGLSYGANPLIAKKELLRMAYLFERGVAPNGNGFIKWPLFERATGWLNKNIGTPEFEKAHRLGLPLAVAGLFYDSDGDKGGGWGWDGELDSAWEFLPFFLWSNNVSKPLFDNSILGADIAGAINLYTIDKMLDLSDYEGDTDYARYRGAHLHYFVATAANSVFISGLHYMRKFPLGQLVGSVPFARMLPSMTSFPGAFRLKSSIDKPNFFTFSGLGLTLFYQSYLTGYRVSDVFSHRNLINTDPYYSWQRGEKYGFAVPFINAVQAAFGYRSTLGQTVGRIIGIPPDLGLAKVDPPFLDKALYINKEDRLLGKGTEPALDEGWKVFVDTNTSLDLGGVVGRMIDEKCFDHIIDCIKNFKVKPIRVGHWRWERRGVETWTSPIPLKSLDGRKGYIEQLAVEVQKAQDPQKSPAYKKMQGLTTMYHQQFMDPEAPWHHETKDQSGMIIFAFISKYFAQKAREGELQYYPFLELTQAPELSEFFKAIPAPRNHEELLSYVTQVDEGQFLWILQKAPSGSSNGFPVSSIPRAEPAKN